MGTETCFSTSLGVAPGMETMTSIMGTLICGSSSLGSITIARIPKRTEPIIPRGVSFESVKTEVI